MQKTYAMADKQYNVLTGIPKALLNGTTTATKRVPVRNAPALSVKNSFFGSAINRSINFLTSFGVL